MVFAGLFATDSSDTALLADAMEKILLTDNSVVARKESSLALGTGFRCGFLGVLHMEVFIQAKAKREKNFFVKGADFFVLAAVAARTRTGSDCDGAHCAISGQSNKEKEEENV